MYHFNCCPVRYEDIQEYEDRIYLDDDVYETIDCTNSVKNTDNIKQKKAQKEYERDRKFYEQWRKRGFSKSYKDAYEIYLLQEEAREKEDSSR